MDALAALLHQQEQEDTWRSFTAQMLWYLNRAVHKSRGMKFDHPSWLDIAKPRQEDARTGEQIVTGVIAQLRARRKKRERRE